MGPIICDRHGHVAGAFVCPHFRDAILGETTCAGAEYREYPFSNPLFEGLKDGGWYCPDCIRELALPPTGTVIEDDDEWVSRVARIHRPVCSICLDEWHDKFVG